MSDVIWSERHDDRSWSIDRVKMTFAITWLGNWTIFCFIAAQLIKINYDWLDFVFVLAHYTDWIEPSIFEVCDGLKPEGSCVANNDSIKVVLLAIWLLDATVSDWAHGRVCIIKEFKRGSPNHFVHFAGPSVWHKNFCNALFVLQESSRACSVFLVWCHVSILALRTNTLALIENCINIRWVI